MECKVDDYLLQEYLDNSISHCEKILLEEHLKYCKKCRNLLVEMKLLFWELDYEEKITLPDELHHLQTKVLDQICTSSSVNMNTLIKLQVNICEKSSIFLKFVPGYQSGTSFIEKNAKKLPDLLKRKATNVIKKHVFMRNTI